MTLSQYIAKGVTYRAFESSRRYDEIISYNKNSAPLSLVRYGKNNTNQYTIRDALSYRYNGNQLVNVSDTCTYSLLYSNSFEFVNGNEGLSETEYTYDGNGNMIRDLNSKIELIEYDKLDHPIRIQFMDGSNIQCVYAADGRKLKVTHQTAVDNLTVSANRKLDQPETQQKTTRLPAVDNTIVAADRKLDLSESQLKSQTVQYYMGNFVLTNGILDRYYFGSDGYAKFTNGKPVYSSRTKGYTYSTVNSSDVLLNPEYRVTQNVYPYYFVKDHLGSNRMVADNPSTMVSYYPYGGIYYDDILFYQADDSHLYNGKETIRRI